MIVINCFRYLDFKSIDQVDYLMLNEYQMLMKAYQLKQVDKEYYIHLQAWANNQASATKQQGKKTIPVFSKFNDFFDYEKREASILKPKPKKKKKTRLEKLMLQANS